VDLGMTLATELSVLLERDHLCLDCLVRQTGQHAATVARALEALGATGHLWQQIALCARCVSVRMSYKVV
jgi:hypothetical protein